MEAKTLALYLGCQVRFMQNDKLTLVGIDEDSELPVICLLEGKHRRVFSINEIKPLLRPLSSMTEEERVKHMGMCQASKNPYESHAHGFRYLLSKGFDLFELIEKNEAIDSTKL